MHEMPPVRSGQEGGVKRLDKLLSHMLPTLGIDEAVRLEGIKAEWTTLFGEPLSLHMWPIRLKGGELLAHVDSSLWLQQVSFFKTEILKKLLCFNVTEVRFRLGRIGRFKKTRTLLPEQKPEGHAIDRDSLLYIEETTRDIADQELRESIRNAMKRSFEKMKAGMGKETPDNSAYSR
jgi:Dna[CI] antecedent, DciA